MRHKELSKFEFTLFLMNMELTDDDKLPYLENYISFEKGVSGKCDMYGYLVFLRSFVKEYRSAFGNDHFTLKDYLDSRFPPIEKPSDKLEDLDSFLKENYMKKDNISIGEVLGLINKYK